MIKLKTAISLQNVIKNRQVDEIHDRRHAYPCNKRFIFILIIGILIFAIVTVPTVVLQVRKAKNKPTIATTQSTEEKEFVPLYNLTLTNATKWRQNGITVLVDNYTNDDTIDIDESDNIYICRHIHNHVEVWSNNFIEKRIVAGGNGKGSETNQLSMPTDIIINRKNNSMFICDRGNRRIVQWLLRNVTNGNILISNIDCYKLAIDDQDYLYVSNQFQHEVRRWNIKTHENILVAGGNGPGDDSTRLHRPSFIFVDKDYSVYVTEPLSFRVMKWIKDAKEGILVAGGHGQGKRLIQVSYPAAIIADHLNNLYVSDRRNHRIMRRINGASDNTIIVGGNGDGNESNQLSYPEDFVFDKYGNTYILSSYGTSRIQKFYIASN